MQCMNCKFCSPVISQIADYYCYKKGEYLDKIHSDKSCNDFESDSRTISEKENAIW